MLVSLPQLVLPHGSELTRSHAQEHLILHERMPNASLWYAVSVLQTSYFGIGQKAARHIYFHCSICRPLPHKCGKCLPNETYAGVKFPPLESDPRLVYLIQLERYRLFRTLQMFSNT